MLKKNLRNPDFVKIKELVLKLSDLNSKNTSPRRKKKRGVLVGQDCFHL